MTNGPATNRLNIVFLAEGYRTNEQAKFLADATNAIRKLLSIDPYKEYQAYYNAYAIAVASRDSGSSHLQWGPSKNTYFGSSYDKLTDRIVTIPPDARDSDYSHGRGKVDALLKSLMPRCTMPVVLVNDIIDGGAGGPITLVSVGPTSAEIFAHESGHTLAKLGDEYEAAGTPDYPATEEPNTTRETRRQYIKWKAWIDAATPIPTPATESRAIGLFQGANYHSTGWYRPKLNCMMRASNAAFCEVCSEALVKSFYQRVRPIDAFSPANNRVSITNVQSTLFSLTLLQPLSHSLEVRWRINGSLIPDATNSSLNLPSTFLTNGAQTVSAQVRDLTAMVRNDPANLLVATVAWTVVASGLPAPPVIQQPPQSQTVRAGTTAVFTAIGVASGQDPLSYQWQRNGTNLAGETSANLVLSDVQPNQAGDYNVIVSNLAGRTVSPKAALAVTVPLSLQISGPGTVLPNVGGQWLVDGQTYSLTAKPGPRCIFLNWAGSIATNTATLKFQMREGMALSANFADPIKPTLSITAPADRARLSNATMVVTGRASDNAGIQCVQFRANGGAFTNASTTNHWTNWVASFSPVAGTNIFEVIGFDTVGNQSVGAIRRLFHVVTSPLSVVSLGNGTLVPDLNGKLLEIGRYYTVKAVPVRNNLFSGWDDGSRNPSLTFLMQSNLTLQAAFVTNPFGPVRGTYSGLFVRSDNSDYESSGSIRLTVTDQGAFTGTLAGANPQSFSGRFWVDGTAEIVLAKKGKPTLTLTLQLDLTEGTDKVTGKITDGTWTAPLVCDRAVFDGLTRVAPQAGKYTLAIVAPTNAPAMGDGFGAVIIKPTGALQFSATLADGTVINQSSGVSKDGRWPLYVNLYSGKGALTAWISFESRETSSLEGDGAWIKLPSTARYYGSGLTNKANITGSRFNPKALPILNLHRSAVVLTGGGLENPLTLPVVAGGSSTAPTYSSTNGLSLTVTGASGLVAGKFNLNGKSQALKGIVLQEANVARGFFLTTNSSGAVLLFDPAVE